MQAFAKEQGIGFVQIEQARGGIVTLAHKTEADGKLSYLAYTTPRGLLANIQIDLGQTGDVPVWLTAPEGTASIGIVYAGGRPYYYALNADGEVISIKA